MKQISLLIMFAILTSACWTQQLETINIPQETKIEVVKTLVAYPLILDKIEISNALLKSSNRINVILQQQLDIKQQEIEKLNISLVNLEKEKKLFKTQLRKQKMKSIKIGAAGALVLGAIIFIK